MVHQKCSMHLLSYPTSSSHSDFVSLDGGKKSQKWSEFEVQSLQLAISGQGKVIDWCEVAKSVPGRTGKQCREKYKNDLNPSLCKEPWSQREEYILARCHSTTGNQWSAIAKFLPRRSDNNIKNHWNSTMRSIARNRRRSLLWMYSRLVQEQGNVTSAETFSHAVRLFVNEEGQDALDAMHVPEEYFDREEPSAPPAKSTIVRSCSNSYISAPSDSGSYQTRPGNGKKPWAKQDSIQLPTSHISSAAPEFSVAQTMCYSGQAVVTGYEPMPYIKVEQEEQQPDRQGTKRSHSMIAAPHLPAFPSQPTYLNTSFPQPQELHDFEATIRLTKYPKRHPSQVSGNFSEDCSAATGCAGHQTSAGYQTSADPLLDIVLNWSNQTTADAAVCVETGWTLENMVGELDDMADAYLLLEDDLPRFSPDNDELAPGHHRFSPETGNPAAGALPSAPLKDHQSDNVTSFAHTATSQESADSLQCFQSSNLSGQMNFDGSNHQHYRQVAACDDEYQQLLSMHGAAEEDNLGCASSLFPSPPKVRNLHVTSNMGGHHCLTEPGSYPSPAFPSYLQAANEDSLSEQLSSPHLNFLAY